MKARIVYNLDISQLTTTTLVCNELRVYDEQDGCDHSHDYTVGLGMVMPGEDGRGERGTGSTHSTIHDEHELQIFSISKVPSKRLRDSLFRVAVMRRGTGVHSGFPLHHLCIPYMKFWHQDEL
jgi:hypothetical protein